MSGAVGVHIAFVEVEESGRIVGGENGGDLVVKSGVREGGGIDELSDLAEPTAEFRFIDAQEAGVIVGMLHAAGFEAVGGDEVAHGIEGHAGEIVEVAITSADEFIDESDFLGGGGGIFLKGLSEARRLVPVSEGSREALDAEEGVGVAAAVEGVDDSGGGGEERPVGARGLGIEALKAGGALDFSGFGSDGEGLLKLSAEGGEAVEPEIPFLFRGEVFRLGMDAGVKREAGAGGAVVEPEDEHPTAVEEVMECGGIAGEGVVGGVVSRFPQDFLPGPDVREVREEAAGMGLQFVERGFQAELAGEEGTGAGGVDDEAGEDCQGFAQMFSSEDPAGLITGG